MERRAKTKKPINFCVEVPLPDGCLSMFVGCLVRRNRTCIVLTDAAWVACTGRRNLFMAGTPDSECEIEPYVNGQEIELPATGAIVTQWPHPLLRVAR